MVSGYIAGSGTHRGDHWVDGDVYLLDTFAGVSGADGPGGDDDGVDGDIFRSVYGVFDGTNAWGDV